VKLDSGTKFPWTEAVAARQGYPSIQGPAGEPQASKGERGTGAARGCDQLS